MNPITSDPFEGLNLVKVDELSKIPKYMQIVEIIKSDIENGIFQIGEQIPSINETSAEFDMARDTVEKAYKMLKKKGILSAVKGKGYFVAGSGRLCAQRGLVLLSEFDDEIKSFYDELSTNMPDNSELDVLLYNGDSGQLERNIVSNYGHYDFFIISMRFDEITTSLKKAIDLIPEQKKLFVQNKMTEFAGNTVIGYNCKNRFYKLFDELNNKNSSYKKFTLVCQDKLYFQDIFEGFADYCIDHQKPYNVSFCASDLDLEKGDAFFVQDDKDLIDIIKRCRDAGLEVGEDVGIISFLDSSIKEVLAGGITVITHDYKKLARTASDFLINQNELKTGCELRIVKRSSF